MIYESDLYLLVNLFFPNAEQVAVLDPKHKIRRNYNSGYYLVDDQQKIQQIAKLESMVVVNLTDVPISSYPFDEAAISGAISFRSLPETLANLESKAFYYVVNEEVESIRWVFPGSLAKPFFLNYYDPEANYGNFFLWFCWLCGYFRQMNWMADASFRVFYKDRPFYEQLTDEPVNGFTLFTGRYLNTGKVVLQLVHEKSIVSYLKWPLTEEAENLLSREYEALEALNGQGLEYIQTPKAKLGTGNSLLLSNILQLRPKGIEKWTKFHFKGLGEYTRAFLSTTTVEELLKQADCLANLEAIKQGLKEQKTPKGLSGITLSWVYQQLVLLMNQLPLDKQIPVSLVHWDFTPENVQIEEGKLKVLDWEHARFDHPALIDVFAFIAYGLEENYQPDVNDFEREWQKLMKWTAFEELCQDFQVNINRHFQLYLLLRLVPKLNEFLASDFVPYWMNWHLYFWKELLTKANETESWLTIDGKQGN